MKTKGWLIAIVLVAVTGWAVWYYFIREKTLGEKLDDTTRAVERSVNDAVKKVAP